MAANLQRRMLSKEDEASAGEDVEVRREDQEKINKFSRLHQREQLLEDELKARQKDKDDLQEVSQDLEELELEADEDTKVQYKVGDSFVALPLAEVQELLSSSTEQIDKDVSALEDKMSGVRDEMEELKVALYARFGRSINLET